MATQTITDAVVFPQDPGTSPNDGIGFATDPPSGASWALLTQYKSGGGDYVLDSANGSLGFSVDEVNDELTIDPGVAYIKQSTANLSVQSEVGSNYDIALGGNTEIVYAVLIPTPVTVGLDVDVENDVYLAIDPDTRNSARVETGNTLTPPTDPSIELGTVDSNTGSVVSRPNDNPNGTYDTLEAADSVTVTDGEASNTLHYGSNQDRANAGIDGVAVGIGARVPTDDSVSVGYRAALDNTGDRVTAAGYAAAESNTGFGVTAAGYEAAESNTGDRVTAAGYEAAENNTGFGTTVAGYRAARGDGLADPTTMGDDNIGVGENAIRNNQASGLIAIGQDAGINAQTDDQLIITQRDGTRRMVMDLTTGDLSITGTLTENATL